jgi:hypothetical protein
LRSDCSQSHPHLYTTHCNRSPPIPAAIGLHKIFSKRWLVATPSTAWCRAHLDRCRAHLQPVSPTGAVPTGNYPLGITHACTRHVPERPFRARAATSHATKFVSAAPFNSIQIVRGATPEADEFRRPKQRARAATTSPSHATKFVSAAPFNSIQIVEGATSRKQTNSVARSGWVAEENLWLPRQTKKRNTFHRACCSCHDLSFFLKEESPATRFQRRCRR